MIAPEWFPLPAETSPVSWLFAVLTLAGLIYWGITARLFSRWRRGSRPERVAALPPVVFFRPVKRNVPRLEEKASTLLRAARPGDRVIFGVSTGEDEAICLAACREQTPEGVTSRVVFCPPPMSPPVNPKVWKLMAMTEGLEADAPEHWIVSDSEALPDRDFFDLFRAEWLAGGFPAFTACYRFTSPGSWPQLLDRLPLLLTLWPGVMAADAGSDKRGLGFALGACMAVRRADLQKIGGWNPLLPLLAEDNRLGAFLQEAGVATGLSRQVITLDGDPMGWRDWLRHQHRIALTYRVCIPWGVLGMVLTHGVSWATLFAAIHYASPAAWAALAVTATVRIAHARRMGRALNLLNEVPLWRFGAGVLIAGYIESLCWLLAWLPLPVRWNERALKVDRHGRFLPEGPSSATTKEVLEVS